MSIAENIVRIEERIQNACNAAGRKRDEIILMGVSKFIPVEKIEEAYNAGIRCFGESRVKEAAEKLETFRECRTGARLHLIGSLQRNKAKAAALFFDCIQSVDREELVSELVKHSGQREKPLEVLFEIHTGEETKSGFAVSNIEANKGSGLDDLFRAVEIVLGSAALKPCGVMTMAPFTTDAHLIRSSFRQLVKVQKELEKRFPLKENDGSWACLSMGMSNDFEIAIEEGSTLLRVGSSIFAE
jgi:hypothetical protein